MPNIVLKNIVGDQNTYSDIDTITLNTDTNEKATFISQHLILEQKQADWNETNPDDPAYIRNKPETFGDGAGLPEILPEDEGKILGVQDGQWGKVQADFSGADWNAESGQNGFIKNKPDLDKFATKQQLDAIQGGLGVLEENFTELDNSFQQHEIEATQNFNEVRQEIKDSHADWNVYDPEDPASILNRPFGDIPNLLTDHLVTFEYNNTTEQYEYNTGLDLNSSLSYTIICNGLANEGRLPKSVGRYTLSSDGIFYTSEEPEKEVTLTLYQTDNVERLNIKYLPIDEIINEVPQGDWNNETESSRAYIQNKPFYTTGNLKIFTDVTEFEASEFNSSYYQSVQPILSQFATEGDTYTIVWDGKIYRGKPRTVKIRTSRGEQTIQRVFGNSALWAYRKDSYDYLTIYQDVINNNQDTWPFVFQANYRLSYTSSLPLDFIVSSQEGPHTIQIFKDVKKLDSFYLPEEALRQPVQSDWSVEDKTDLAYIRNKPSNIAQIPSNWNQTNVNAVDYIKNKPFGYADDFISPKEVEFTYNDSIQKYQAEITFDLDLRDYDSYSFIITWDNQTWSLTSKLARWVPINSNSGLRDVGGRVIGNTDIAPVDLSLYKRDASYGGGTNPAPTAPFLIMQEYLSSSPDLVLYSNDANLTHKFGFKFVTSSTKRLDKQWLPTDTVYTSQLTWSNIKNTPSIPDAQIQADWSQTNSLKLDYIKNKPKLYNPPSSTINGAVLTNLTSPSGTGYSWQAEVLPQADWGTRDYTINTYIRNKPFGKIEDVLFEREFTLSQLNGSGPYFSMVESHYLPEVYAGEKYLVNGNTMMAMELPESYEQRSLTPFYFGNPRLLEELYGGLNQNYEYQLEDNGADFFLGPWWFGSQVMAYVTKKATAGSAFIKISPVETIRKIPVEFLPDEVFDVNLQIEYDPTLTLTGRAAEAKPTGDRIRALEKYIKEIEQYVNIIKRQGELIEQLQNEISSLNWRVSQLEQGSSVPSVKVEGEEAILEGSVVDEELEISYGQVEGEELILGKVDQTATIVGEELVVSGNIEENETLQVGGIVNTADETWEV